MSKNKIAGRPKIIDGVKLQLLRAAFNMDATDEEACAYAEISPSTLYNYQQKNPDFLEQKNALKKNPVMRAKKTVFEDLHNVDTAKWYLERRAKDEFSPKAMLSAEVSTGFTLFEVFKKVENQKKLEAGNEQTESPK